MGGNPEGNPKESLGKPKGCWGGPSKTFQLFVDAVDSIRRWNLTVCTQARQTSPQPSFGLGSDCCTAYYTVLLYCNPGCIALSVQQRLMSLHRGYRPPTKFAAQVCCNEHICTVGCIAQNANCTGSLLYYQSQKLDKLLQEELIQAKCM